MALLLRLTRLTALTRTLAAGFTTDPLSGGANELVTEDGVYLITADGVYIGVPSA